MAWIQATLLLSTILAAAVGPSSAFVVVAPVSLTVVSFGDVFFLLIKRGCVECFRWSMVSVLSGLGCACVQETGATGVRHPRWSRMHCDWIPASLCFASV